MKPPTFRAVVVCILGIIAGTVLWQSQNSRLILIKQREHVWPTRAAAPSRAVIAAHATDSPHPTAASKTPLAILSSADQVPAWAVGFGKEFWRRSASATTERTITSRSKELPSSVDLGDLMDRVTYAFRGEAEGEATVNGSTYKASISPSGMAFSPVAPAATEDEALASTSAPAEAIVRTRKVRTADRMIYAHGQTEDRIVLGNTVQTLLDPSCGLVEHFESNPDGIAVSWIIAHAPSSTDLTVELDIAGMTFTEKTEHGHHFADSSGVSRLRVGRAILVDSSGAKSDLSVHYADNALQITVSADLLARAAYPVAIDPIVSAEFGVDVYPAPTLEIDYSPSVAHKSGQYLVVWNNREKIMGVRLTAGGQILDPGGIEISSIPGSNYPRPRVTSTSAGYLVVWRDPRIRGARVTTSGVVLDLAGIEITPGLVSGESPDVANNGNASLVVWGGHGSRIFSARVADDGVVLDPAGIQISSGVNDQGQPAVACNGFDYVVVWRNHVSAIGSQMGSKDVYGAHVTFAGGVGATFPISIVPYLNPDPFALGIPAIAALGADYLVAWEDYRIAGDPNIFGARITAAGVGTEFSICSVMTQQNEPAIAANNSNFLVVWRDGRFGFDIYGARVSAGGSVLDPGGFEIRHPNHQTSPCVAASSSNFLVAWDENDNPTSGDGGDVLASFISPGGTVIQPSELLISTGFAFSQLSPKVAFDGTHFLAVWRDYRKSFTFTNIVYGIRLTATGQPVDPSGLLISGTASYKDALVVSGNPNQFFVAWADLRNNPAGGADIYGCRISGATVLDPNGIPISTAFGDQISPAVATDGTDFFVVWTDDGGSMRQVIGSRIAANGSLIDPGGFRIAGSSAAQDFPDVAFGGGNYFVAWQDSRANPGSSLPTDIYAARVHNGTVLDPSGILVNASASAQRFPRVAFNGTQFLVVWQDDRNGAAAGPDIYASLVNPNGTVINTTGAALFGPGPQRFPAVAAGGSDFLTVCFDGPNQPPIDKNIYGTRVKGGTGASLDGTGFGIATSTGVPVAPSVAYGGNNNFLVVYQGLLRNTNRILARFVTGPPPGTRIPGLFNTGVDTGGAPLADNSADSHYTVSSGGAANAAFAAASAGGAPIPPWVPDNSFSAWISPTLDTYGAVTSGPMFIYRYETTFDLAGYDPATARIVGEWSTDNVGFDILINGQITGHANSAQFTSFTPFAISTGFIHGLNTLTFIVHNEGSTLNPTGLRVQMDGTVAPLTRPVMRPPQPGLRPPQRGFEGDMSTLVLTWEGRPEWSYVLEYNDTDFSEPRPWSAFPNVITPEGAIATFTDTTLRGVSHRLYRVLVR